MTISLGSVEPSRRERRQRASASGRLSVEIATVIGMTAGSEAAPASI